MEKEEFQTSFQTRIGNMKLFVNDQVCDDANQIFTTRCSSNTETVTKEAAAQYEKFIESVQFLCSSGLSNFNNYALESCIKNSTTCDGAIDCFKSDKDLASKLDINTGDITLDANHTFPAAVKSPAKKAVVNALLIGLYYGAIAASLVLSILFTGFMAVMFGLVSTVIAGFSFIAQFALQLSRSRYSRMQLTKWELPSTNLMWLQNLLDKKPINSPSDPPPPFPVCDVWIYWSQSCDSVGSAESKSCSHGGSRVGRNSCNTHFSPGSSKSVALLFERGLI